MSTPTYCIVFHFKYLQVVIIQLEELKVSYQNCCHLPFQDKRAPPPPSTYHMCDVDDNDGERERERESDVNIYC